MDASRNQVAQRRAGTRDTRFLKIPLQNRRHGDRRTGTTDEPLRRTGDHGSRRLADTRGAGRASTIRAGRRMRSRARSARLAPRRLRGRRRGRLRGTRVARRGVGSGGAALQDGHRLSADVRAEIRVGESRSGPSDHRGPGIHHHRSAIAVVAGD